jgi:hypothetical protein
MLETKEIIFEEIEEMPDERFKEEYQEYLVETGQVAMAKRDREILHLANVDEWNEINGDVLKMPDEDPNDYLDIGGALVPVPPEWSLEELGLDEDGDKIMDETGKPALPDD